MARVRVPQPRPCGFARPALSGRVIICADPAKLNGLRGSAACRRNWFSVAGGGLPVGVSARLNAFRFARHLRGATVLPIMLSCMYAGREHQPCGMLSGEYSPVFRQARFDSGRRRRLALASCFLGELHAGAQAKFGVDVGEVGLHSAR